MAQAVEISPSSVRRIWTRHGLQPHRVRSFKLSNDPKFADKLKEVVGLYIDPPAHAVVLSIDEKSQIQALDRTQPGLPMKKGRCATMTHDYKRNGTTTLFAALDMLEGKVIGRCMQRHRHQQFIRFLNTVEREVAADKAVHVILDNYATHKHPKVRGWLARHPRVTFHFTPTSCSWANAVEGWFARLTRQRLKRGVFTSIVELQAAINRFIANDKPKPFVWTKSADAILAAVTRGRSSVRSDPLGAKRADARSVKQRVRLQASVRRTSVGALRYAGGSAPAARTRSSRGVISTLRARCHFYLAPTPRPRQRSLAEPWADDHGWCIWLFRPDRTRSLIASSEASFRQYPRSRASR